MPELPEVQTTASILNKLVTDLKITDVWTDYGGAFHVGKENIKDKNYFSKFREVVVGKKIQSVGREGKNVIIKLSGEHFVIVHMKMTGHLLYGKYFFDEKNKKWEAADDKALANPFNRFIHLVFSLSDGKHLALSDMRKFAKVSAVSNPDTEDKELLKLGPDPLGKNFSEKIFAERLALRSSGKIKQVLMDQEIISGIGNIYSDEILWESGVHPEEKVDNLPPQKIRELYKNTIKILKLGIKAGGDSMSDYRNPFGKKGNFQKFHRAYRRTGEKCPKRGCSGIIKRIKVAGRSAHFCPEHQKKMV